MRTSMECVYVLGKSREIAKNPMTGVAGKTERLEYPVCFAIASIAWGAYRHGKREGQVAGNVGRMAHSTSLSTDPELRLMG